jgi:pilus assembly protein CpaB
MLLEVANQPIDSNPTFTTGGDVSRFQRRTVPAKPRTGGDISSAMANFGKGLAQGITGNAGAPVYAGPVVRVARGNAVTAVPAGAR